MSALTERAAASSDGAEAPLLEAISVSKHFPIGGGVLRKPQGVVRAVDDVSFTLRRGETLGLVGESGSGKSTLGRLVLRLLDPTSGSIRVDGEDITARTAKEMTPLRKRMQLIFQDPVSSFSPRMTIEEVLTEPMVVHGVGESATRRDRCADLLEQVGLSTAALAKYPHQFSGGQAQRIGIARALATDPELLVCDEAVSALDVSVQAQVLNLLKRLQRERGLAYLFIAHDLNVVRYISDRVCVMYLGSFCEVGPSDELMGDPQHPYTRALVDAIPSVEAGKHTRKLLEGEIPSPSNPPKGCRFHTRCPVAIERCAQDVPALVPIRGDGREASCHLLEGRS